MAPSDSVRNALLTVVIVIGRCLASEKGFTPWTTWSPCNRSCGYGIKRLTRQCVDPDLGCEGSVNHGVMCRLKDCPIDGQFTDWTQWTVCNHPCGGGVRSRTRECTNPAPQHGGLPCTGDSSDTQSCNNHECPRQVDGQFTDWTQWTVCNHPCGGGVRSRTRECTNPAPQHGGLPCTGDSSDTQSCNNHECSRQGYGPWAPWRDCSATCGNAVRTDKRKCVEPYNKEVNGEVRNGCFGHTDKHIKCEFIECPIDGGFTDWTQWTACSVTSLTCDGGTSGRTRACTNPAPQHGGSPCSGDSSDSRTCNTKESDDCPILFSSAAETEGAEEMEAAEGGAAAAATGEAEADTGGVGAIVGGAVGALAGTACVGMAIYGGVRYYKMLQRIKMERMENAD